MKKVLVANRGEIALRIFRACRQMGIASVAVYSDGDAAAEFVEVADEAFPLGGVSATETYLNIPKLLAVAKESGADAVHPGYGFLSEKGEFAQAVCDAGLTFIGPSVHCLDLLGNKESARSVAEEAGIPMVPAVRGDDVDSLLEEAKSLTFPVLVKAVYGGGGKGMRLVSAPKELREAILLSKSEAKSAFASDAVYVEQALVKPRHIEVQILADGEGNVIHLFERECSIQRRHQKVVEECPAVHLAPQIRQDILGAATRLVQHVGYEGAGTVEFLLHQDKFYFLEVNARLQVEHPVTECVTGIDLVQAQLRIAAGETLPWQQNDIQARGHAIEARIYAEDPATGFLPSVGSVLLWESPKGPGVRVDSAIRSGDEVALEFDPMLAKVISWGASRKEAIAKLSGALGETRLLGVKSNIAFIRRVLQHKAYRDGQLHTGFIDEHQDDLLKCDEVDEAKLRLAAALAATKLSGAAASAGGGAVQGDCFSPWRGTR